MATRGRKPKPTAVKQANGNPGKRALPKAEPVPVGDLVAPPIQLNDRELEIWRECLAEAPKGLLKRIDGRLLARYCAAFALWEQARTEVLAHGFTVEGARGPVIAPAVNVMQKQDQAMRACESELGFTPSSRSRLQFEAETGEENPFAGI